MAQNTGICGKATISYDENCSWLCRCNARGCRWEVSCPDGKGGWTSTTGTGHTNGGGGNGGKDHISIDGSALAVAKLLEKESGMRIEVPENKLKERITLAMDGDVHDLIKALGFRASPHRE
jgi:hypothetical protein